LNLRSLVTVRWIYRSWYYFRLGYGTYLTFILGYVSTLVTVYYLAIRNMPDLLSIFPRFETFGVLATVVGVPLAVAIGWAHLKRSGLFISEQDISVEANPYLYKLPPGYTKELTIPAALVTLKVARKLAETNGILTDTERAELDEVERKFKILMEGGYVGTPRRKLDF
jgi:hypothetical protein